MTPEEKIKAQIEILDEVYVVADPIATYFNIVTRLYELTELLLDEAPEPEVKKTRRRKAKL